MKYCSKCGKEIMDEAVICVHCGCAVESSNRIGHSEEYEKIIKFEESIKPLYTLSIIALICSFGIGIFFSIIIICIGASKKIEPPVLNNPTIEDKAKLIQVENKFKRMQIFSTIPVIAFIICIFIIIIAYSL